MNGTMAGPPTILHVFSTFAVGGPQTRFATIANRLGGKYRHLIASMSGQVEAAALLATGVDYSLVPVLRGSTVENVPRFAREIGRLKPDLLVTYNWGALEWALANVLRAHVAHIHIEDGFGPDEAGRRLQRRVWLRRVSLIRTRMVAVPSRNLEHIALEEWKVPRHRLRYVPNGVDIARFTTPLDPSVWAVARRGGELVVGTCAALRAEKNLARLIRSFAAARLPNARLVICGDGPERTALENAAARSDMGGRIHFTGYLAAPETALAAFDIFAMSSDTEQMPYGLLEAMASGLPAVATDVGDVASIVAESNRKFVVPVSDEAALTAALAALGADASLRAKLGSDNQAKARREYALEAMIAAYDRLFAEAIGAADPNTVGAADTVHR